MSDESVRIDDGGPAFPGAVDCTAPLGMSLRDYFAAKAMQGLVASGATINGQRELNASSYAPLSYEFADAMLAARKAGGK